ncbi:MAG: hypothetical protein K0S90_3083 [Enterobacteriaceae bacterium]|jgi:hypothetical protein|nr:hypothetical protein [Enterobacteriaceae bacterium]
MIGDLEDIVNIIRALLHWEEFAWQQTKKKRCRSNAFFYYLFAIPAKGKPIPEKVPRTH